jgi:hypothetical protein
VSQEGTRRETSSKILFDVESENDLWSIYLRAPRYTNSPAIYQVEIGLYDPQEIDVHQVQQAFAWEVRRDPQGRALFLRERPGGLAVSLAIQRRFAVLEGGEIKIKHAYGAPGAAIPLEFGVDRSGDELLISGESMARRVN